MTQTIPLALTDTQRERLTRIRRAFQRDIEKLYAPDVLARLVAQNELDLMTLQELRDMPSDALDDAAGSELLADIEALRADGLLRRGSG